MLPGFQIIKIRKIPDSNPQGSEINHDLEIQETMKNEFSPEGKQFSKKKPLREEPELNKNRKLIFKELGDWSSTETCLMETAMMKILSSMTIVIDQRIRNRCEPTKIHNCKKYSKGYCSYARICLQPDNPSQAKCQSLLNSYYVCILVI